MHAKHLAPVPPLCATLLLSACVEAEQPLSTQDLTADLDGDKQAETVEYSVFSPEGAPGSWDAGEGALGAWAMAEDASGAQYYLKVRELFEIEDASGAWVEASDAISGLSLHG
jgi:hypothetical protein